MDHHTRHPLRKRGVLIAVVLGPLMLLGLTACAHAGDGLTLPERIAELASKPDGGTRSAADGYIPESEPASIFDDGLPAIANLDPALRTAVQDAAAAAAADGQELVITSGWRSAAYQQSLLDDAIVNYRSYEEARKWVNTPELSTHVTGDAVDIGPIDAQFWLIQYGFQYGLCQTYVNERWHFELATDPGGVCPVQKTDATS